MSLLRSWRSRRSAAASILTAGHPGQEGVSTDRLFKFLTSGPLERITATQTEMIVDNLDPNEDAQLFHDWVMGAAIGWVSEPATRDHWHRFPGIKLNEIDWHALSDRLRANFGWPVLRQQTTEPGGPPHPEGEQHGEDDGDDSTKREAAGRSPASCGKSAGWHRAGRCSDPHCIERIAVEGQPPAPEPEGEDQPDLTMEQKVQALLYEIAQDSERSGYVPDTEDLTREVTNFIADESGVDAEQIDAKWVAELLGKLEYPGWRAHPLPDQPPPGTSLNSIRVFMRKRAYRLQHPESRIEEFKRLEDEARDIEETVHEMRQEDEGQIEKTSEKNMGRERQRLISLSDRRKKRVNVRSAPPEPADCAEVAAISATAGADPFRQAILDWVEFKRRDEPKTNVFKITAHALFNQIKGADLSSWGPFARAIEDLVKDGVIAKTSQGTDWILWHDRRKHRGGHTMTETQQPALVDPKKFNQEAGRLISFIANELRENGPSDSARLSNLAHQSSKWPYDDNFSRVYTYALEYLENKGEIKFDDQTNSWTIVPVAKTYEAPGDVPEMAGAQREEMINRLLDKWRSEPDARPQIEQQLKGLRAFRHLLMLRRAAIDTPGGHRVILQDDIVVWGRASLAQDERLPHIMLSKGTSVWVMRKFKLNKLKKSSPDLLEIKWIDESGGGASGEYGHGVVRADDFKHFTGVNIVGQMGVEVDDSETWSPFDEPKKNTPDVPESTSDVKVMDEGARQQKVDALLERWQSEPDARPQIEQQLKSLRALRALFLVRRAEKDQLWAPDPEIVKNTWRRYQCTVCSHVQAETTNHLGAIMSYCKKCSWAPSKGECYNPMGDGRCYRKFTYIGEIDERHQDESGFWDSSSEAWTRRGDAYDPANKKKEKVVVKRSPVEVLAEAGFSDPQMLIGDLWTAFTKSGAREHRDHQITSVHLTGSRWKGDAREDSDLDVVVFHSGNAMISEANQAFRAKVAEITGGVVDAFLLPQTESWDHPMSGNIMTLTASSATSNFFRAGERQSPRCTCHHDEKTHQIGGMGPVVECQNVACNCKKFSPEERHEHHLDSVKSAILDILRQGPRTMAGVQDVLYTRGVDFILSGKALAELMAENLIRKDDTARVHLQKEQDNRSDLQRMADDIFDYLGQNPKADHNQIIKHIAAKWGGHPADFEGAVWNAVTYLIEDERRLKWDRERNMWVQKAEPTIQMPPMPGSKDSREVLDQVPTVDPQAEKDRLLDQFNKGEITREQLDRKIKMLSARIRFKMLLAARPMRDLGPALDKARNMFGPLSPEIRKRILNFLQNPTTDSWDDIQSIIISGFGTIWQAMIQIDPSFPRSGRRTDQAGNVVQDWERIPTPEQVLQVLQKNTGGERQSLLSSWMKRRAGGTDWALVEKLMKAYWDGRVAEDWAGGLDCTGDSEALADHLFAAEMEPEHISSYYRDANGNLWSHDWLQLDGKVIDITHSQFGAPDYLITNVGDPRYPSMDELTDEETARANPSGQMPTASLLARWFSRRAEGADPAAGPFNAPWPDQIQAFMQAVYDQTAGHPFTRGQRVWNDSVIVEVHPWRGGPDPEYPWIITLKWLQSMDPRKGRARECLAWLTALADEYGVPLDLHAKPTGEPKIPKPALKNLYKDHGFERDRTQGPDDMVRHPLVAAWRARRAQAETQIGTITYRGREVLVVMPTKDIDQWLKLRTDDRIIHDAAVGQQFTELVGRLYTYAAMKIEPNANIRESMNISLYPDIERALDYYGYGRDEAQHKLSEPGGEDKLKQAAFSMFEQQRADLMSPQQAADLLMNMAVVLHKDMGMTMDEAKARLSSLIIEWGGGGPENLHLNSLTQKWRERRAANSEQKLLRELRCTAIGSDSGTENEAVLPKGAVVGVQPHSNDHTIFFYSPIYSKIIVRGRVMKTNQYSAPVQEFRAATDIGYGEGKGYEHESDCFCDECMAKDDLTTRRCPSCGSRECPGDGDSIDCRKPGSMTIKDVPVETRDSLLDKFNRGEIDEPTLRRRMKQLHSSLLGRWQRRAESQAALIHEVLGQITEDEIANSGIAHKATDFVWTRTTINPKETNWGQDAIAETQSWLKKEEDDYLSDMGEPRVRGGDEAKRQALASEPVVVIRGDDGVLWVLDGNHRTAQAVIWGVESLPALLGVKKPGVGRTPVDPSYKMGSMFERWVMRQANDPLKKIIEINGVKVGIEWPKGSTRTWKHLPGNDYEKLMKADYGYIRQTEGEDGEEIDVYAGPDRDSDLAFVVTQLDKKTGEYDEDKIMLGYSSEAEAKASYLEHMEKAHFGGIKKMSWDEFLKLVPKSQRVKEKTAAMVDDPGSQMVLTDDLRVWERASKGQGDHVDSFVLPKGTTVKVLKKFRLNHGGSPELLKITFWPPKGKAGAGLPTRGSGVVRADDLRFVVSGGVVGQVPEQSIPSNPKMIENHIVDLLRKGPSTISRDLSELIGEGKGVMLDENGEVADFDRPFADMVQQVIGQMLDRGVIRFDGGTAEFSLLKDPEPTSVEHVPEMSQVDVQSKIDALLDQLAAEPDPNKKKQIEQRIRSLSAATKEIWVRRAGDTMSIEEQRSPGAVQECDHGWPGKKPGERGWCGRCRL